MEQLKKIPLWENPVLFYRGSYGVATVTKSSSIAWYWQIRSQTPWDLLSWDWKLLSTFRLNLYLQFCIAYFLSIFFFLLQLYKDAGVSTKEDGMDCLNKCNTVLTSIQELLAATVVSLSRPFVCLSCPLDVQPSRWSLPWCSCTFLCIDNIEIEAVIRMDWYMPSWDSKYLKGEKKATWNNRYFGIGHYNCVVWLQDKKSIPFIVLYFNRTWVLLNYLSFFWA